MRTWTLKSRSPPTYDHTIIHTATGFVNAITSLPANGEFPQGLVVSGGQDQIIDARPPDSQTQKDPDRLLIGHAGNICALDTSKDAKQPYLVSGSWDCSARIWDVHEGRELAVLEPHEASVWAVLAFDESTVVTGAADQMIRVFSKTGKLQNEFKASDEPVRAICRVDAKVWHGAVIATAGNDQLIKLWTASGEQVATLVGHENFIYSLDSLPSGELVSSGEDRTVRIWKDNECIQTITHPAISVWSVAARPNGDIITGASDKIVRVFTRDKDRVAEASVLEAFTQSVSSSSIPQQAMNQDINKEKLPGPEFLTQKSGTKDSQVQMIREHDNSVSAYQWSAASSEWVKIGTVVDSAGSSGRKQEFQGKDYDFVFDVDIEDGKPPLKLPYNLSSNPYEAAQKFIANNELPISYLDQVANFIIQNTQGASLGQSSAPQGGADPWGSERRYRPDDNPATSASATATRTSAIPQKEPVTIVGGNFVMIAKKLEEFNTQLLSDGKKDIALNPSELSHLKANLKEVENAGNTNTPSSSKTLASFTDSIIKIVTTWPSAMRVPGFDVLRCLTQAYEPLTTQHDLTAVLQHSEAFTSPNINHAMLALRAIANLFPHPTGATYATSHFDALHALIAPLATPRPGTNRNVPIALATIYINYSVLLTTQPAAGGGSAVAARRAVALIGDLQRLLDDKSTVDGEVVYRGLVAIGTLARVPPVEGVALDGVALERAVRRCVDAANEPRIKSVGLEVLALL